MCFAYVRYSSRYFCFFPPLTGDTALPNGMIVVKRAVSMEVLYLIREYAEGKYQIPREKVTWNV